MHELTSISWNILNRSILLKYLMNTMFIQQVLLSAKANINLANNENESPLYVAATGGHLEVVRSLLDAPEPQRSNLEIDASAAKGYTPLHAAASKGNIMIAR